MKLPAFQFYPGDWRRDVGVQSLSFHDRGVWWEMLCIMHDCQPRGKLAVNGKAMSHDQVSKMLGLDNQLFEISLTSLLSSDVAAIDPDTGAIMSRRMVRDERLRLVRSECGKKGGNPVLLNQEVKTPLILSVEDEDEDEVHQPKRESEGKTIQADSHKLAEEIYYEYPRKVGKIYALRAIEKSLKLKTSDFLRERTLAFARAVRGADMQYVPHPTTWFNQGRYDDDPNSWKMIGRNGKPVVVPDHSKPF